MTVTVSQMSRKKVSFWALVWGCGSGLGDQMVQGLSSETDGAGKLTPVCRSDQEQNNLWMKWWTDEFRFKWTELSSHGEKLTKKNQRSIERPTLSQVNDGQTDGPVGLDVWLHSWSTLSVHCGLLDGCVFIIGGALLAKLNRLNLSSRKLNFFFLPLFFI